MNKYTFKIATKIGIQTHTDMITVNATSYTVAHCSVMTTIDKNYKGYKIQFVKILACFKYETILNKAV